MSLKSVFARQEVILAIAIIVLSLVIGSINSAYFSVPNLFRILRSTIIIGIFAMGVLMVLISGGIDVSFPAIAAFSMYSTILIMAENGIDSVWFAFIVSAVIGMSLGMINSVLIALFRLPTLIVTLGTLSLFRGVLLFFVGSRRIRISEVTPQLSEMSRANLLTVEAAGGGVANLHVTFVFLVVIAVIVWLILRYTMFGRALYAIGGDRDAAERVGFNIVRTQFGLYMLVGLMAGIGGMVHCVLAREADPFSIVGIELDVIAAVVLGGASIMGGRGTVIGTLLGVLLITIISSSLVLIGIPSEWQRFVIGALIIIGTAIPILQQRWNQRRVSIVRVQAT